MGNSVKRLVEVAKKSSETSYCQVHYAYFDKEGELQGQSKRRDPC